MPTTHTFRGLATALLVWGASIVTASAAEFNLFLKCAGQLSAAGKSKATQLELALRDSNTTALIQRSNVLPTGERLQYTATPVAYTMLYKLRQPGTRYYDDWLHGYWVVWQPNLKRLATIRLAIDRQDGSLDGQLLDFNDDLIATVRMDCEAVDPDELPPPKF
jgi:hypothetical protein